ncbi:MAG: hypothetical protein HOW73_38085 [Polyangiaceae bacterium]|nr:hypothetical protein [Polyangiaceae bacterium]
MSFLAVLLSASAGVGVGYAAHRLAPPFPPLPGEVPAAAASESAAPSASAPASAEAPPTASEAAAPAPPPVKPAVCMKQLFAEGTFADEPPLDFVCEEANPMKGAARVKEAVVNAGAGRTSAGMKEWAVLGFYELAAYSVLRGRCCPAEPTIDVPASPDKCEPMADGLVKLAKAAKPGVSDDDAKTATKSYADAVKCVVRNKSTKSFGGHPSPSGGEGTIFQKTLDRARGVAPKE